jgi:pilus assembly protein TadC
VIALGWGLLVGVVVLRVGRRPQAHRVRALVPPRPAGRARVAVARAGAAFARRPVASTVVAVLRRPGARAARARHDEVPVLVELVAVAVSAGATPRAALEVAADAAGPCRGALVGVLADVLGTGFGAAAEQGARRHPELARLLRALAAAEASGAPLADPLVRLGRSTRLAARREAERRARTVPVRLLIPLVVLVLPAFALLTVIPTVLAGLP